MCKTRGRVGFWNSRPPAPIAPGRESCSLFRPCLRLPTVTRRQPHLFRNSKTVRRVPEYLEPTKSLHRSGQPPPLPLLFPSFFSIFLFLFQGLHVLRPSNDSVAAASVLAPHTVIRPKKKNHTKNHPLAWNATFFLLSSFPLLFFIIVNLQLPTASIRVTNKPLLTFPLCCSRPLENLLGTPNWSILPPPSTKIIAVAPLPS